MNPQEIQNKVLQDLIDYCEGKMVDEMKDRTKKPEMLEESAQDESDDLARMQEMANR